MSVPNSKRKQKTSREIAYAKIRKAIFRGKFPPGHHLREEALAEFCNVSRTPARQALRMLADEGVVAFAPNKRCYVADVTEAHSEEIFDLLSMLEGYSARLACKHISKQQLAHLREIHEEMVDLVRQNPGITSAIDQEFLRLNSLFHRAVHAASGNAALMEMINRIVDFPQNLYLKFGRLTENDASIDQHGALLVALEQGDCEFAELQMRHHVEAIRREFRNMWTRGDE